MLTLLFWTLIVAGIVTRIVTSVLAITRNPHWYWLAGLLTYGASFLGAWSIGLYLLVIPIVCWMLAFVTSFTRHNRKGITAYTIVIAVILWFFGITYIDDAYLFYPFSVLF